MCGIAGGLNCSSIDARTVSESLKHRGPDDFGEYEWRQCRLFHTRLAIQDIVGGTQPMERDGCVIVFNGEIYNHQELRTELEGFEFRTHADTETLLCMYLKYGVEMFDRIDGMYALAILDLRDLTLFLATDRAGKKPLYIYRDREKLFFASELNTIAACYSLQKDEEAIASYLRAGFFFGSRTPYEKVERMGSGSWMRIDIGNMEISRGQYFSMESAYRTAEKIDSESEALELLDRALDVSVRNRMLSSDLEVGAFLSGGIDSSLAVAVASRYTDRLKTFTVAFDGGYDESRLAELTAVKYGTEHHVLRISMNLRDDVERILSAYGQPFMDSSAIPSWYVSRAAKKHVTVVLNGDGADELFGGYRRYVPVAHGWMKAARLLSPLASLLPPPHEKRSRYNYLYRLLKMGGKQGSDLYLSSTTDIFEDIYEWKENEVVKEMEEWIGTCGLDGLSRVLCLDFGLLLFSDLLVKMDIATMAHSLEGRSPFLGKNMLETAVRLPDSFKVRKTETKWILRRLAQKYLPEELIHQPKRGFEVPLKKWVEEDLKEPIHDMLASGCHSERYIRRRFIDDLLEGRLRVSEEKRAKMLWTIYALEIWEKNR
jgi:asparagine synthase (glutamine-hydrolysing)